MQIVCISRGSMSGGKALAEKLAAKLGYDCLSREELTEAATRAGIPVGKLEMAVVNRRPLDERLVLEKNRYQAFITATLCERALQNSLVYHGRTGHLVLPGLPHVLRVRVIQDTERRVESVMERLGLDRAKVLRYLEQVDEDRRRWVRTLYGTDWRDPGQYDLVVNLANLVVDNAAAGLVHVARLPEFQVTPVVQRSLQDLLLAARCRLQLGSDQRTRDMDVRVTAQDGVVTVTYLPRDVQRQGLLPAVLEGVEGVGSVLCTMASSNVLWIQERFDPANPALEQIVDVAGKWNAAVELMQLTSEEVVPKQPQQEAQPPEPAATADGGILDDSQAPAGEDEKLAAVRQHLIAAGRAGSVRRVPAASPRQVLNAFDRSVSYNLVVVGEVFSSKPPAARKRLTAEMVGMLADNLHLPVVEQKELKAQFLFSPGQWARMLVLGLLAATMFLLVFANQLPVGELLVKPGTGARILATAVLVALVPLFAYCYGTFTRLLLRLLRFE